MRNAELAENTRNIGNIIGVYSKSHQIPNSVEIMLQWTGGFEPPPKWRHHPQFPFFQPILIKSCWFKLSDSDTLVLLSLVAIFIYGFMERIFYFLDDAYFRLLKSTPF